MVILIKTGGRASKQVTGSVSGRCSSCLGCHLNLWMLKLAGGGDLSSVISPLFKWEVPIEATKGEMRRLLTLEYMGYDSNHHFHVRYAKTDIKQQKVELVIHLMRYLLSMRPEQFHIAIWYDLQFEQGSVMTRWLIDKAKRIPISSNIDSSAGIFLY
jgi:hypothetical protein